MQSADGIGKSSCQENIKFTQIIKKGGGSCSGPDGCVMRNKGGVML